jgi:hypothetical protein
MARILLAGIDPDLVDFTRPGTPPGLDADFIRAGIAKALFDLKAAGHEGDHFYVPTDPADLGEFAARIEQTRPDCVVIGGGVRHVPENALLFEAMLNILVAASAPPRIALPDHPGHAVAAVARVLG